MAARESLEAAALGSSPIGVVNATAEAGRSYSVRIPVGIIGIITPWNSPFLLAIRAIAPALVAGNAVLLKPDPQTPICGGVVFAELFRRPDCPPGYSICCREGAHRRGHRGRAASRHDQLHRLDPGRPADGRAGRRTAQAGVARTGRQQSVHRAARSRHRAADSAGAWGSFFHQGQICLTAGRHLVHESVAADYSEALAEHAPAWRSAIPEARYIWGRSSTNARPPTSIASSPSPSRAAHISSPAASATACSTSRPC